MPAQYPFQIGIAHISTTQPSGQNKLHHAVSVPYDPRRTCSIEFSRICPCAHMWVLGSLARECLGSLAREGRYFQVELNSACPHNGRFNLVLPISRPLNPLARRSCIMLLVYHTNHAARVAENLPEFARVRKCEVQAPLHANNLISMLNRTVRARTMPISNWYCPYLDHSTLWPEQAAACCSCTIRTTSHV